jgi:hypothetical protein
MTDRHPARGARIATGLATGLALVGMVAGYQAAEAAEQVSARQVADLTFGTPVEPAPVATVETAPVTPVEAAPAPAAPAPAAPAPAPVAPAPAPPPPAPPVDGSTGGS